MGAMAGRPDCLISGMAACAWPVPEIDVSAKTLSLLMSLRTPWMVREGT